MSNKLETAYHEAGHAVAAYHLNIGIKSVTIKPDEERGSLGSVTNTPISDKMMNAIEEASYDASWGGFINGRTRRYVEAQIMVILAGGLVHQQVTGKEDHELGTGVELVDPETAKKYAEICGGTAEEWTRVVWDGDLHFSGDLASRVTGSEEEEVTYVAWLRRRTKNLIRKPGFIECVKALAVMLLEKETLSGKEVRQVITSARSSFIQDIMLGSVGEV